MPLLLMDQPWKIAIVGILAGALFTLAAVVATLWTYLTSFWERRKKNKDLITGEWFCYFYSNHHSDQNEDLSLRFIEARLNITSKFWGKHAVVERREGKDKKIKYQGEVEQEGYCILIKMSSANNDEFVLFRLYHPLHTGDTVIYGLQLSSDFLRRPYCGALLISENQMTEDKFKAFLNRKYSYSENEKMITTETGK